MRILIFPMGSAGDVHPFIGVGKALQARGHDVQVATNSFFESSVTRAGLEFIEIGSKDEFEAVTADPNLWHPQRAFETIIHKGVERTYERVLRVVKDRHRPGETVLVSSTLGFAARNARDKLKLPLVTVHLAPAVFLSRHRMPLITGGIAPQWGPGWLKALQWWIGGRLTDRTVLPGLNAFRRENDLPPVRDVVRRWWHSPDRVIGLFPEWYAPPQPDWPAQTRLTGFPLFDDGTARPMLDELARFLNDGPPPVVFAPGSAMAHGWEFFGEAVKALKLTGMRGVLQSGYPETIPSGLAGRAIHVEYAPFSELFKRSAALVYHGGIGTCAQALRAGIPHLVQYMAHDQLDNASRVRDLGVGEGVAPREFKAEGIARSIYGLLSDSSVRDACARVTRRFASEEWMEETCALIEAAEFAE